MNSRLKVRIWHDRQGMIYPDGKFILVAGDKILKLDPELEEERYFIMPLLDCDILQCTGLKDVNGKDIYESDILKWSETTDEFGSNIYGIYIVKWIKGQCSFKLYDPYENNYWDIDDVDFDYVIGNTYENSGLLPGQD